MVASNRAKRRRASHEERSDESLKHFFAPLKHFFAPLIRLLTLPTHSGINLATESIPGYVLQLYVWLTNPEQAGTFALGSIAISAMTTGFTSAMIAYDLDVDVSRRKTQPMFYGYIPDDNSLRMKSFMLITLIR